MAESKDLDTFRAKWLCELKNKPDVPWKAKSETSDKCSVEESATSSHDKRSKNNILGNKDKPETDGDFRDVSGPETDRDFRDVSGPETDGGFRDVLGPAGEAICEFPAIEPIADCKTKSRGDERTKKRKRLCGNLEESERPRHKHPRLSNHSVLNFDVGEKKERYLDAFLADLNEMNEIPFFDLEVPREIAINIFKHLSAVDLCRCAQVSKAWKSLAEDELLWCNICHSKGFEKDAVTSEKNNWKKIVMARTVQYRNIQDHWKNRVGKLRSLQHIPGGILRSVTSHQQMIVAGYSSREVKLWDLDTGESCIFRASETVNQLQLADEQGTNAFELTHLACNQSMTAALYTGLPQKSVVNLWSNESSTSTHAQAVMAHDGNVKHLLVTEHTDHVITSKGSCVIIHEILKSINEDHPTEDAFDLKCHKLEEVAFVPDEWVTHLAVIPRVASPHAITDYAVIATAGSRVKVHVPERDVTAMRTLHDVLLQNVQLMECTTDECVLALQDFNPSFLSNMYLIGVYSLHSGDQVCKFSSGPSAVSSLYKTTEMPNLVAAGTFTGEIKIFDQRCLGGDVIRLRDPGHSNTCVQMDEWKVVSGSQQGFVSVWDYRMSHKCWDMHNRSPVKYMKFYNNNLITANIPPRGGAAALDCQLQDGIAHQRYRGSLYMYDFKQTQDSSFLPTICHSDYDMPEHYSYNIRLAMPYDKL